MAAANDKFIEALHQLYDDAFKNHQQLEITVPISIAPHQRFLRGKVQSLDGNHLVLKIDDGREFHINAEHLLWFGS